MNRMRAIQAIGEAVIPLLGFFFFGWNLYFILLFYFIDLVSSEVFLHLKVQRILKFQSVNKLSVRWKTHTLISSLLLVTTIIGAHIIIYLLYPGISFENQFVEFIMYEEAGIPIPQGFILLPLVFFGNYQQYKTMFLMPKYYTRIGWNQLFRSRRRALIIALAGIVISIGLSLVISLPIVVYLLALVTVKFWIDYKYTA